MTSGEDGEAAMPTAIQQSPVVGLKKWSIGSPVSASCIGRLKLLDWSGPICGLPSLHALSARARKKKIQPLCEA